MPLNESTYFWEDLDLPSQVDDLLRNSVSVRFPRSREEIMSMAMGGDGADRCEVGYDVDVKGWVVEAEVAACKNGLVVNYPEPHMRRRDPNCLVIGDAKPTDKPSYADRFGKPFAPMRTQTFDWLKQQKLAAIAFMLGGFDEATGHGCLLIAPENAGFFVGGLADLQGMLPPDQLPENFQLRAVVYVAPPFRHSHFDGQQVVVHNRTDTLHEIFAYNLYPGPSAKKGIYGVLLSMGESEEWVTLHGSTVQVVTPYDNVTTIMHEGASGAGKSEMLEHPHRQQDGRLLLGRNIVNQDTRLLTLKQGCTLHPVTDDMAMCHPSVQSDDGYLTTQDAEQAWFVRLDHIRRYGTDPYLEALTVHAPEPMIFMNLQGIPRATCLIWDHTLDAPGVPCPNPRVIIPRRLVPNVVDGAVEVMIRSFGVRTPPCTAQSPSYGILGYLHILPPALAWLWRLVSPRGHANPSITDTAGMTSEGVGSYWPFASGRMIDHANLLLRQIQQTPRVRYSLTPNQHVGAWSVGFMPQWIAREYLGRRGTAQFRPGRLIPARCPLLGYTLDSMQVEGTPLAAWLLRVDEQREVGTDGYDQGANILRDFFVREVQKFAIADLDPLGRDIFQCLFDGGNVADYQSLLPGVDAPRHKS